MADAVSMPSLGMTMEEGTVIKWHVALGGEVKRGALLLIIESEKNEVEIEAATDGVLRHIYVPEGETVPCGALLAAITGSADEPFDEKAFHEAEHRPKSKGGGAALSFKKPGGGAAGAGAEKPAADAAPKARASVAPAARAAARKLGIDPAEVPGSGPDGRVTKQDVEAFAAAREALVPASGGVRLEVLREGEGEALLLLPGFGTDVSVFTRQMPVLTPRFEVFGMNPRGVGLSEAPDAPRYEPAETAQDAAAVLPGPAHVVGASLGAAAAIELALQKPEQVKSLTLITPFVHANARLLAVCEAWSKLAAECSAQALAAALLPWFFSAGFLSDEAARTRTERGLAQTLGRSKAETLTRLAAGMAAWSGTRAEALAEIQAPTLVLAAGEDLLTPNAEALAEQIPGARAVVIPGAGHALALEAEAAVNEALLSHLS